MNPELVRNLWVEARPHRIALVTAVVGLTMLVTAAAEEAAIAVVARFGAVVFLVVLGAHAAALSIIGEVRNRTWDQQRLSALGPWAMVWGKLAGATIMPWYGGALCVAVLVVELARAGDWAAVPETIVYHAGLGVLAQGVAMVAALGAIQRFDQFGRLHTLGAQLAGTAVGLMVVSTWPDQWTDATLAMSWWGIDVGVSEFVLASLVLYAAWALVGCHRLMRRELAMVNGPAVLVAFLAFIALYVAGIDDVPGLRTDMAAHGADARLLAMFLTLIVATYLLVAVERKDPVTLRALVHDITTPRLWAGLAGHAPGWLVAWCGVALVALLIVIEAALPAGLRAALRSDLRPEGGAAGLAVLAISALGFVTRDCALFVLVNARLPSPRADTALTIALILAYVMTSALAILAGADMLLPVFIPAVSVDTAWGIAAAWLQAGIAVVLARRRLLGV